jgi:hypothetical protein
MVFCPVSGGLTPFLGLQSFGGLADSRRGKHQDDSCMDFEERLLGAYIAPVVAGTSIFYFFAEHARRQYRAVATVFIALSLLRL